MQHNFKTYNFLMRYMMGLSIYQSYFVKKTLPLMFIFINISVEFVRPRLNIVKLIGTRKQNQEIP